MLNTWAICATSGRHTCLERSLRFFLDQTYEREHTLLIFNNSPVEQRLAPLDLPTHKNVVLVNQHIDSNTGEPYKTLGAIYNDSLKHVPKEAQVITFWDDDDIFLPSHIRSGTYGLALIFSSFKAYKPSHSFFRNSTGLIERVQNNLEPSIFAHAQWIKDKGFSDTTSDQHHQWLDPLVKNKDNEKTADRIYVDPLGEPTLVYNWGDGNHIPTFKTSGNPDNPQNFQNYRNFSQDHGDQIITPLSPERAKKYYEQVEFYISI